MSRADHYRKENNRFINHRNDQRITLHYPIFEIFTVLVTNQINKF